MKKKIILDCDPGHDDAVAILLAGIAEEIELLGIVAVAGNSYLKNTVRNALILTEMANLNVPVFKGSDKPLLRKQIVAPDIHGESGLEGANLPKPSKMPENKNYLEYMAETITNNPDEITLVAVGPLTNIAKFALNYPNLVPLVKELVIMGGGIEFGNVTPRAEFNIYADPEAAQIVFNAGFNLTVFPLDVTHKAKIYMDEIKEIQKMTSEIVSKMGILLEFFHQTYYDVFKIKGAPLHDPCTIAYLINPDIFDFKEYYAQVETKGELTYGETVVDYWHLKEPNSKWALNINREKFIELLFENLKKYN
ncbi:nucleoside hydrolase [Marinitoga sp. 1155]|uniref:nucleoside hydrolase n=1 Tax=Marinitoga sp. 1155 TaxID=1428448 RepID=UPI0006416878|nr:nucleoside hydrolase [Marinitoga sp. 1155]KLO24261.1 uridine nucleosidase [Marinitoga sp. 1155]